MSKAKHRVWEFGSFRLDESDRLLLRDGGTVGLTPKVFDTLIALLERSGHLVEKEELMQRLWPDTFVEEGALTRNISDLRKVLGEEKYIETVPKRGYRFVASAREIGDDIATSIVEKTTEAHLVIEEEEETEVYDETGRSGLAVPLRAEARPYPTVKVADRIVTDSLSRARTTGHLIVASSASAHSASSAEFIVSEIKRYKRAVTVALSVLLLVAMGIGYWSFIRHSSNVRTPITSIAVLPFVNTSNNPEAEYLSDGISESLINSLSQLPGVKVIARSSSFKYKGNDAEPQEVARSLGVEAILSGRVVQRGENLLISAELVDARDGTQVWGAQYPRKATDVQAVVEEIARTISEKLRLRLSGAQEQQLTKRATQNPQAYQLYLNGLFYRRKSGIENVRKALDYYNQAVALDPNFALAFAEVADAYTVLNSTGVLDPKEATAKEHAAVQKALELDETLAEAHIEWANLKWFEWDYALAEREYRRAIELNPNLAWAHHTYGQYLSTMERHTEALAEIKRAQELDPLGVFFRRAEGWELFYARRYDEAIEKLRQTIELEPDSRFAHVYLSLSYAEKGMYSEAIAEHQKAISIDGETNKSQCYLGYILAKAGKRDEALAILNKLKTTKGYISPAVLAVLYAGLGDKEEALASLQQAYAAHDLQMQFLKVEPGYDSLRSDARFQDLLRRVGFTS